MCGISGFEFVVILVIALLVLGPEKIPEILRFFGGVMRQVKELSGEVNRLKTDMLTSPQVEELKKQIRAEIMAESGSKGAISPRADRANDIATIDALKQSRAAAAVAGESSNPVEHVAPTPSAEPAHPAEPEKPDPLAPRPAVEGTAEFDPNSGSDPGAGA